MLNTKAIFFIKLIFVSYFEKNRLQPDVNNHPQAMHEAKKKQVKDFSKKSGIKDQAIKDQAIKDHRSLDAQKVQNKAIDNKTNENMGKNKTKEDHRALLKDQRKISQYKNEIT